MQQVAGSVLKRVEKGALEPKRQLAEVPTGGVHEISGVLSIPDLLPDRIHQNSSPVSMASLSWAEHWARAEKGLGVRLAWESVRGCAAVQPRVAE